MSRGGDDGYRVGYKRPPLHSRWKPGQSGNAKGAPKSAKKLRDALLRLLDRRITVHICDRRVRMTYREWLALGAVKAAGKGNPRAIQFIHQMEQEGPEVEALEPSVSKRDRAIIDAYFKRQLPRLIRERARKRKSAGKRA